MSNEVERLGSFIISRRVELGHRVRSKFAESIKLSDRIIADAENGVRELGAGSYAVIEQALEWAPGSIRAVLDGGSPTPMVTATFGGSGGTSAQVIDLTLIPAGTLLDEVQRRLALLDEAQSALARLEAAAGDAMRVEQAKYGDQERA